MPTPQKGTQEWFAALPPARLTEMAERVRALDPDNLSRTYWPDDAELMAKSYAKAQEDLRNSGGFLTHVWKNLNPITMVEGIAAVVSDLPGTAKAVWGESQKARALAHEAGAAGDTGEMVKQSVGAVPLVGPALKEVVDLAEAGNYAGAAGAATGLLVPGGRIFKRATKAAGAVARATRPTGRVAETGAAALERWAGHTLADVMTPKGGPNAKRFAGMAQDAAPELLKRGLKAKWTFEGWKTEVGNARVAAEEALDAVVDARVMDPAVTRARVSGAWSDPKPVLDYLKAKRREAVMQPVSGSRVAERATEPTLVQAGRDFVEVKPGEVLPPTTGRAIGKETIPPPKTGYVQSLDDAIAAIEQLGPTIDPVELVKMRRAYDNVAKIKYVPDPGGDLVRKLGEAEAAADVAGAIRSHFGKLDPAFTAANKEYHLLRSAADALEAVDAVQRTRPTTMRRIFAELGLTGTGYMVGGVPGATVGASAGLAAFLLSATGTTDKVKRAFQLQQFANAVRGGKIAQIGFWGRKLRQGAQAGVLTGRVLGEDYDHLPAITASPLLSSLEDGEYEVGPDGQPRRVK